MIVPGKEAQYLAPAADNLFFPPAKDGYNYFDVVSHAMWRNSSQIIWRKQGTFYPRQGF